MQAIPLVTAGEPGDGRVSERAVANGNRRVADANMKVVVEESVYSGLHLGLEG